VPYVRFNTEGFFNVRQVAIQLKTTPLKMWKWVYDLKIVPPPSHHIGSRMFYSQADVNEIEKTVKAAVKNKIITL